MKVLITRYKNNTVSVEASLDHIQYRFIHSGQTTQSRAFARNVEKRLRKWEYLLETREYDDCTESIYQSPESYYRKVV